jgi:hypothetical protein
MAINCGFTKDNIDFLVYVRNLVFASLKTHFKLNPISNNAAV